MNVLLLGTGAAIAIAILSALVLGGVQQQASDVYATQSVRVGEASQSWSSEAAKK